MSSGHAKSHPSWSQGKLVKVGSAPSLAEAERLEQLLREAGLRATLHRSPGSDPAADGPRDIMVPSGGANEAGRVLGGSHHPAHSTAFAEEETLGLGRGSTAFRIAVFAMIGLIVFWLVILVFFSPF